MWDVIRTKSQDCHDLFHSVALCWKKKLYQFHWFEHGRQIRCIRCHLIRIGNQTPTGQ
jgi:hypothetical protein